MARKYIKQIINQNFIYPNDDVSEYDVEIVHDINNNSVIGAVANLSATTVSSSSITFRYDYTWERNNAEVYIDQSNFLHTVSVHMLAAGQNYFKPWRLVTYQATASLTATTVTGTAISVTVPASALGLTSFTNGTYYFEFRFIGHRAIFPVCAQLAISTIPAPTPTPTTTAPPTPTPTPTPTPGPAVSYTTGATLNVRTSSGINQLYVNTGNLAIANVTSFVGAANTAIYDKISAIEASSLAFAIALG